MRPKASLSPSSARESLKNLLAKQIENYHRALSLEHELGALIPKSDFDSIRANTERKRNLMEKIRKLDRQLGPRLRRSLEAEGRDSLPDGDAEELRQEAASLLEEILLLEAKNLKAIAESRAESIRGLRLAKTAKRAALSYKPSREGLRRRKLDTEG